MIGDYPLAMKRNIAKQLMRERIPVATGGFGGLSPPNKLPGPPNGNMKHYKPLEFFSNFNIKHPWHKPKAPPHEHKAPY